MYDKNSLDNEHHTLFEWIKNDATGNVILLMFYIGVVVCLLTIQIVAAKHEIQDQLASLQSQVSTLEAK